jgi:hypothetical protein
MRGRRRAGHRIVQALGGEASDRPERPVVQPDEPRDVPTRPARVIPWASARPAAQHPTRAPLDRHDPHRVRDRSNPHRPVAETIMDGLEQRQRQRVDREHPGRGRSRRPQRPGSSRHARGRERALHRTSRDPIGDGSPGRRGRSIGRHDPPRVPPRRCPRRPFAVGRERHANLHGRVREARRACAGHDAMVATGTSRMARSTNTPRRRWCTGRRCDPPHLRPWRAARPARSCDPPALTGSASRVGRTAFA